MQEARVKKKQKLQARRPGQGRRSEQGSEQSLRERILTAAFAAFTESGYAGTSTLEIATRANVSKRELYASFDSKQAMLTACIAERAKRMRSPLELHPPGDRQSLERTLQAFGAAMVREVSHPSVLGVYRLALAEAERSPEVAQALHRHGRKANHAAISGFLAAAQARGLIGSGDPGAMASQYLALLWGDLLNQLLLRVAEAPTAAEIEQRARAATKAFLVLHSGPCPSG
jgi:AcrR family transcriptional regulator